ncbi:MAG: hypothetical protein ACTSR7_17045, partial [Promethearchaeota archaeon]
MSNLEDNSKKDKNDVLNSEEDNEESNYLTSSQYQEALEKYFETYPGFFKSDASKGLFLLG